MFYSCRMLTKKSVIEHMKASTFSPRLIPKAYAFVPQTEHPDAFSAFANERMPLSAFEAVEGTAQPASEKVLDYICACPDAGRHHLRALEAAVDNAASLAILTIEGIPVATLKRSGYGMPNVLAFRHQTLETADGTIAPLIPGGIYVTGARTIIEAWAKDRRRPIVPIDGTELYPATMFFEKENPRTARRKYAYAESLFEKIIGG
jgi:hypothetical protein